MLGYISRTIIRSNLQRNFVHTAPVDNDKSPVKICEADGVREIILNNPKKRNMLSNETMELIVEGLTENVDNKSLRCIVLSSTGPVFSSGHSLKELDQEPACQHTIFKKCEEMISKIYCVPVPVIAKVNGLAAAGGCQLVASCDIVVASEKSSFSTPGINFGLFCHTPGVPLARILPRTKSLYMLISGFPISAQDAYIAGLVSVLAKNENLDEEVSKICDAIKSKSRPVITMGKEFFYKQSGLCINDAYTEANAIMVKNLSLNDGKEGIKSFIEKKKPKWTHS